MTKFDRRRFLHLSGVTTVGVLAGCSSSPSDETEEATRTASPTPTETTTPSGSTGTPGADVLGGPDDLRAAAEVRAAVLDEDQGAGKFVFTPAVVWLEPGGTVTWHIEEMAHSVTAYHPDNDDKQLRIPEGASGFDSGTLDSGETYEHTFDTEGVHNYYCIPHEGLGMVGMVVVGSPNEGPGTTNPSDVESNAARDHLNMQLEIAGISPSTAYAWDDATWDSYWYSLYNMSTNISMSGNGVIFPHNEEQQQAFDERVPAMLEHSDVDEPPVKNPNLNMAAFTKGDPHFTQKPVLEGEDGRPDASTLQWDMSKSSKVVSPSSLAWTHLKGVTWAKNFEVHFDVLPSNMAAKFRSQVLTTLAQIGVNAALIAGGPEENGALTKGDAMRLVSAFNPAEGTVPDDATRPHHHAAMLWFLSDLTSLANGGWYGYQNPEPLIPADKIQQLTDGLAKATMETFAPADIVEAGSTRDLGEMLGAVGWYGTHAGSSDPQSRAADYANDLAAEVESNLAGNGMVKNGAANQAATQGVVGQGLVWASQIDGVDQQNLASDTISYMLDSLWDEDAGTFASGERASTYAITARDAGDVTGGLNAADAVLGMDGVKETYATYFNQTFNKGMLQRAERPPSRDAEAEFTLPLPPNAGGEFGQAAVYNTSVEYDTDAGEWSVTDPMFDTAQALYLANQDIWISQWGGDFFQGRGVPGRNDSPT